jgi:hypothetical protein
VLGEKLRYAHGADYVRAALEAAGLTPLTFDHLSTRTENGVPVPGLLVIAGRNPSPLLKLNLLNDDSGARFNRTRIRDGIKWTSVRLDVLMLLRC